MNVNNIVVTVVVVLAAVAGAVVILTTVSSLIDASGCYIEYTEYLTRLRCR